MLFLFIAPPPLKKTQLVKSFYVFHCTVETETKFSSSDSIQHLKSHCMSEWKNKDEMMALSEYMQMDD